jgi:hypothetical protein
LEKNQSLAQGASEVTWPKVGSFGEKPAGPDVRHVEHLPIDCFGKRECDSWNVGVPSLKISATIRPPLKVYDVALDRLHGVLSIAGAKNTSNVDRGW